jgi:hypothetical protein
MAEKIWHEILFCRGEAKISGLKAKQVTCHDKIENCAINYLGILGDKIEGAISIAPDGTRDGEGR